MEHLYKWVAVGYQNNAHIIETASQVNVLCNAMRKDVWDAYSMSVLTVHVETAPEAYVWHDRQVGQQTRKARSQSDSDTCMFFGLFFLPG